MKKFTALFLSLCLISFSVFVMGISSFAETNGEFEYNVLEDNTAEITKYTGSGQNLIIPSELDGHKITKIGDNAFENCSSITAVTVADGVTAIGFCAFAYCNSIESVTIPESVTSIGMAAFIGCSSLTAFSVPVENADYCSQNGILFNKDKTEIICYPAGKTTAEYEIPDSVTAIGIYAFTGCASLETVSIPDSTVNIGDGAFSNCVSLKTLEFPDSVTRIGNYAFACCNSLEAIVIPNGTANINDGAFSACSSLISITIPDSVTSIGEDAFSYCPSLTGVIIPNSVTRIDNYAFAYCSSLINIIIPDSVTVIGDAFHGCNKITLYGHLDSYAQSYATEKSISFAALGDADANGTVNSNDYEMIKRYVMCTEALTAEQCIAADYNCDGAIDAFDAIAIDVYLHS